jgi:hypothetical protein
VSSVEAIAHALVAGTIAATQPSRCDVQEFLPVQINVPYRLSGVDAEAIELVTNGITALMLSTMILRWSPWSAMRRSDSSSLKHLSNARDVIRLRLPHPRSTSLRSKERAKSTRHHTYGPFVSV